MPLAGSADGEAELGFGGDGVDDGEDGGPLVAGELTEVGEAGAEGVVGSVQRLPGRVGGCDEVADAGVEGPGDADAGFEAGGDPPGFVAADLAGVTAYLLGELGLRQWDRPCSARSSRSRPGRNGLGMWWPPWSSREVGMPTALLGADFGFPVSAGYAINPAC